MTRKSKDTKSEQRWPPHQSPTTSQNALVVSWKQLFRDKQPRYSTQEATIKEENVILHKKVK
jgi:hypothetical protein